MSNALQSPESHVSDPFCTSGLIETKESCRIPIGRGVGAAWNTALAADRPTLIEVKTDPEVPSLPPHISFEQAGKFMRTMVKGDAGGAHIIAESARQVLSGVLPGDKR